MVLLTTASKFLCLSLFFQFNVRHVSPKWFEDKYSHSAKPISGSDLKRLALQPLRTNTFETLLDPILIPRVSGTENHKFVKQYLIDHMQKLGWTVETDAFTDRTPLGVKSFENIIATLNPDTPRRLVLACHYDSKYSREDDFIGATDSAVPCAMLLHLAEILKNPLDFHKNSTNQNVTLQYIFFDGEEAFVEWNAKDSIYGSRHIAQLWQSTPYALENQPGQVIDTNFLHRIVSYWNSEKVQGCKDVMVLLDLIGTPNPKFYNFFDSTAHCHTLLVNTENDLRKNRLWSGGRSDKYFQARRSYGGIEDDHIPFIRRGVDVVHVIPSPFPSVWHSAKDNKDCLDFDTIDNLNKIFRTFVAGYLHLNAS